MPEDLKTDEVAVGPPPPTPPKWLDAEFIGTSLRSQHADIKVTSLHIEAAVGAGENYACIVFRALAQTNHGDYALIIKCMPQSEVRAKFVREGQIVTNEICMYEKTLPLFLESSLRPNIPQCYFTFEDTEEDGLRDMLVLRDMKPQGFRTRQRQLGLDAAHCRLALTELAHLHGLSAALRIQQPDVFREKIQESHKEKLYTEEGREKMQPFVDSIFHALSEAVIFNLPFRFHAIADLMKKMSSTAYTMLLDACKIKGSEEELSKQVIVLNHGDFWSNNILYQYENTESGEVPIACIMLDYQIARCNSPALDLLYFFFTSTEQAIRRQHMDALLQLYLDEARAALNERGVTNPGAAFYNNVAEIKEDMRRLAAYGFVSACFVLPIVIAHAKDAPDLESLTEEDLKKLDESPFLKMYSGPLFCKRFAEMLEDFDDMGFFTDILKSMDSTEE